MYQALIIFHVLVAAGIITLVLLQQGKGADAGAAFGSGASGTVFGARGSASFLTRCTAVLAALFFASSLGLAILGDTRQTDGSFMDNTESESPVPDLPLGEVPSNNDVISDLPDMPNSQNATTEPIQSSDAVLSEPNDLPNESPVDTEDSPTQTLPTE